MAAALDEMGKRFVSAWKRLEGGDRVRERHVTFRDLPAMLNALTSRRLEVPAAPSPSEQNSVISRSPCHIDCGLVEA